MWHIMCWKVKTTEECPACQTCMKSCLQATIYIRRKNIQLENGRRYFVAANINEFGMSVSQLTFVAISSNDEICALLLLPLHQTLENRRAQRLAILLTKANGKYNSMM